MNPTSFMWSIFALSVIGIAAAIYNTRAERTLHAHPHSMWILNAGFVSVFLFSAGVVTFNWAISSAKYVLVFTLLCSVIYVVLLAIKNYFKIREVEFKTSSETAYKTKLGKMINEVDKRGDRSSNQLT